MSKLINEVVMNSDQTEQVGEKIHKKLDMVRVADASIKRSDQVRSLDNCHKTNCHCTKRGRHGSVLTYELTTVPTSLFKDNSLRKTDKSS